MSPAAASSASPERPPRGRRAWGSTLRLVLGAIALLAAAFYLAQFMTMAPWDPDDGLILGYIDQVAHGERPWFDFVDAYGPLNWTLPAWFYHAYGEQVIGVRVLLLLLKLTSILLVFALVRRLAHPFYAVLASAWTTLLLGMPWPYLQTAYSFHQALPLLLATWLFLLVRPLPGRLVNGVAAGVTTGVTIWLKLNTGLFLLAAGLLHCLCWMPPGSAPDGPRLARWQGGFRILQWLGIGGAALVFAAFVREHFDRFYLLYLALPAGLAFAAAALRVAEARRRREPIGPLLAAGTALLASVGGLSAVVVLVYFGREVVDYLAGLAAILGSLHYAHPLPPLGEPGTRPGFNESYWLQLPWLVTGVFAVWWGTLGRRPADGAAEAEPRAALHGLFLFVALGGFVVYARSDETHVFQAVVPAVPALFVYLGRLEGAFAGAARARLVFRAGVAAAAVLWGGTLWFPPGALRWDAGDWSQPSMRLLGYRPHPHQRHPSPDHLLRRVDQATDQAARFIDEITPDGSTVLVLTRGELLNFLSHTRPAGGRYKYLFYLAKTGLIDRPALEALLPHPLLEALLHDPPPVVVGTLQESYLLNVLPELGPVLDARYHVARRFGGILVFVRDGAEPLVRDGAEPGPADPGDARRPAAPDPASLEPDPASPE